MTGFIIGHLVGARLRINVNILGGIILILIGVKIFVEGICS
jgi:putative Mn2+ efflux pump MntP